MWRKSLPFLFCANLLPVGSFVIGASLGVEREAELHEVEGDGRSSRQTLAASLLGYERYVSCAVPPESKTWVCDEDTVLVRPLKKSAPLKMAKLAASLSQRFEIAVGLMMLLALPAYLIYFAVARSNAAPSPSLEPQAN